MHRFSGGKMVKSFPWAALGPALLLVLNISCAPAYPTAAAPSPAAPAKPSLESPSSTLARQETHRCPPKEADSFGTEARLSEICKQAAGKVYYELKEKGKQQLNGRVAVVSAVPLSDFKRETEFGRLMAEYLLTDLADRGLKVTELRLGREINILPQTGEFIMTRNIGELANNRPALNYVVVSTFSNTQKQLIIQGRLVRLEDDLVVTSWRYTLPLNRDLLTLFGKPEPPFTISVKGGRKQRKEIAQP
jgi:TolB-like protein